MGNCLGSTDKNHSTKNTSVVGSFTSTEATSGNGWDSSMTRSNITSRCREVGSHGETDPSGHILPTANLKIYTLLDLKRATRNFRTDTVLCEGAFGRVFIGWVDARTLAPSMYGSGMRVAIKKRNPESMQGFEEWQSEVKFLGRLSHPHLVKLLGYCSEDKELLLVNEFMQRGSLDKHLFRRRSTEPILSWDIRIKIALGAARGLAFLHTPENHIIYRNFQASHILLDGDYNAKISNLSLARSGPVGGDTHVSTRVMGTFGYAAPEYIARGHLYLKSDVYGFGVVLLEILTSLRVLDTNRPSMQHNLIDWAKPFILHPRKLKTIIDKRMDGQYSTEAVLQAAQLSLKCLAMQPKARPSMNQVVEALEKIEAMKIEPKGN